MPDNTDVIGPISYMIVEFPANALTGEGLPKLIDLVDRGIIRILDLLFVTRNVDGSMTMIEVADLDGDGDLDLAVFEGASSGLLDQSDIDDAAEAIEPGASAAILVFENSWAASLVGSLKSRGADIVAAGYIPQDVLLESLDATDA